MTQGVANKDQISRYLFSPSVRDFGCSWPSSARSSGPAAVLDNPFTTARHRIDSRPLSQRRTPRTQLRAYLSVDMLVTLLLGL